MARIILASGSPRRQELLQRIGLREFEISVPDVEEWYPPELLSLIHISEPTRH